MVKIINKDILECKEMYIAHQCNCVSKSAKGLSRQIFAKYPDANSYESRTQRSEPGTIDTFYTHDNRCIINMFAQYYPGRPKYNNDTRNRRMYWFRLCLSEISNIVKSGALAFPYGIGSGLAGGVWKDYYNILKDFEEKSGIEIVLYKIG